MPVFNKLIYDGTEYTLGGGGNIGEPLNLTVTTSGLDATITWEDNEIGTIPPTTFQKSELVRKIGSAPTSPSDGVLVVTETVKDTYKTTGYVDQGLTDGETYYYRVFSYSDLGGISYCDAESVTPSAGWQPTEHTLLYIPMDATYGTTDQSQYQRTYTVSGLTHTTFNGVDCYQNSDGYINLGTSAASWLIPSSLEFAANFWVYKPNTTAWTCIFGGAVQNSYFQSIEFNDSQKMQYDGGNPSTTTWSIVDNNARGTTSWHLLTITIKNGVNSFYIDSNLIGTNSGGYNNGFGAWHISNQQGIHIYAARNAGGAWSGYVGEVIMEDKGWAQQDIAGYYDQTKANYGIS